MRHDQITPDQIERFLGKPQVNRVEFEDDVARIHAVLVAQRGIDLSAMAIQSFWEDVSDPSGWVSPENDECICDAFDRLIAAI